MDRMYHLAAAFRDVPLTCGNLTLRPLTAGSVMILMETGNPLFAERDAVSEAEMMQGIFEFIHLHTAPEEQLETIDAATLRAKARGLSLHIGFDDLSSFTAQFQELRTRMTAAAVDIVPDKEAGKPAGAMPETPLTGSPPSSTPSEASATLSARDISSGSCPSSAPSNTSTPPTPQTENAAAGRSRIWEEAEVPSLPDNVTPLP